LGGPAKIRHWDNLGQNLKFVPGFPFSPLSYTSWTSGPLGMRKQFTQALAASARAHAVKASGIEKRSSSRAFNQGWADFHHPSSPACWTDHSQSRPSAQAKSIYIQDEQRAGRPVHAADPFLAGQLPGELPFSGWSRLDIVSISTHFSLLVLVLHRFCSAGILLLTPLLAPLFRLISTRYRHTGILAYRYRRRSTRPTP
jgi:hypothetical protein